MRLLPFVFLSFFMARFAVAQPTAKPTNPINEPFVCTYTGLQGLGSLCDLMRYTPGSNDHAERVVDRILRPIGLLRNFQIQECANTQNCFATVVRGQRFIIYDAAFMQRIESVTRTDWSAISIMAHEIGHHLQGHTIDGTGAQPKKEIEADRFSGFVLHQLGASLDESLVAMRTLGNDIATTTHPAKFARMEAIRKGWQEAEEIYPRGKAQTTQKPVNQNDELVVSGESPTLLTQTTQYYADGKIRYRGEVKGNIRAGKGTYFYPNGDSYVGQFQNDTPHGRGTYFFTDGDRFVGQFKAGKRNGLGILFNADGSEAERGDYENDELTN
jgi:hypothetical protein